ncbi:RNA-directed DNA polymerase from transposon BS [Paramuricea clavata]|uniref:RNA-directed DNA polymerase from transposon BS n=1 Tax=Paramuricea clavata TaxID=317549 RepID=A0A7D9E793_PARCT|nr:RNA-directed DNA polymerase from transposon BS [Paramuricea clavata]
MVYIKEDIPYFRRNDLESINVESIWLQPCPSNSPAHLICVAYRCPEYTISQWIENFEMQLNNAYVEGHQLTIMGDFNIDVSKNTSDSQCWSESMGDLHLHQIVTESTKVTEITSTLLDHVFPSVPHKLEALKSQELELVIIIRLA